MSCNYSIVGRVAEVNGEAGEGAEAAALVADREASTVAVVTATAERPEQVRWSDILPLFFRPDDTFEVRFLGVNEPGRVHAGCISPADLADALPVIAKLAGASEGTYFTPNPVRRPAWAKDVKPGHFPMVSAAKGKPAVDDADVCERRWLIVDIDPARPSGVSATDAEKAAAWGLMDAVRVALATAGARPSVVIDSGNGFHLYYRLREPLPGGGKVTGEGDPVKRVLRALAGRFDTAGASVDRKVYNPSRIMKIPGTWAKKGKDTPDRPHRQSRVMEVNPDAPGIDCATLLSGIDPDGAYETTGAEKDRKATSGGKRAPRSLTTVPAAVPGHVPNLDAVPMAVRRKRAVAWLTAPTTPASIGGGGQGEADLLAAIRAVYSGFLCDEATTREVIDEHYEPRSVPRWLDGSADNLRKYERKFREVFDTPSDKPAGWKLIEGQTLPPRAPSAPPPGGPVVDGVADAHLGLPGEAEDDPHRLAREFLAPFRHGDAPTLVHRDGEFHRWDGASWRPVPDGDANKRITRACKREFDAIQRENMAMAAGANAAGEEFEMPKLRKVSRSLVADVRNAAESEADLPSDATTCPGWMPGVGGPPPAELLPTVGGLIHLPACHARTPGAILPCTPNYFNANAAGWTPTNPADTPPPAEWHKFLHSLWPDDPESVALLQEWFGYLLTPDTVHHKMLFMHGPRRAGKGVIQDVMKAVIGEANFCGPTLNGLAGPFGLEPLLGKTVAVIADARFSAKGDAATVVERLLAISGGGWMTVDRKNRPSVHALLPVRFVLATNEVPKLLDASGAFASRWSVLRFTRTFEKREDKRLFEDKLRPELAGIFQWAVEGWARLRERGWFTVPASSAGLIQDMVELNSPVTAFVADRCQLGNHQVESVELFRAWEDWCKEGGRDHPGTNASFGRDLRSAFTNVERVRVRTPEGLVYVYKGIRLSIGPCRLPEDWSQQSARSGSMAEGTEL